MSFDDDSYAPPYAPTSGPPGPLGPLDPDQAGTRDPVVQPYLRRPRTGPRAHVPIVPWLVVVILLLLVYNFGFSGRSVRTLLQMRQENRELALREAELAARHQHLVGERQGIIDGELVEKYARERYKYLRPGEKIYIPPRLDPPADPGDSEHRPDGTD
jgi:cell division protein FtsB